MAQATAPILDSTIASFRLAAKSGRHRGTAESGKRSAWQIYGFTAGSSREIYPPLTAPAVRPATIWRCANTVNSSTGRVTINAAAASGPQLSWSKEIML